MTDREMLLETLARVELLTEQLRAHVGDNLANHRAHVKRQDFSWPLYRAPTAVPVDPRADAALQNRDAAGRINHHERAPSQPPFASIVDNTLGGVRYTLEVHAEAKLIVTINGHVAAHLPINNLVKAATRVDPTTADAAEREIRELREKLAKAEARAYEWEARATLAEGGTP